MAALAESGGAPPEALPARLVEALLLLPWGGRRRLLEAAAREAAAGGGGRVSFFFSPFCSPGARTAALERAAREVAPGEVLALLDYNAPRRRWWRYLAYAWFCPWLLFGVCPRRRLRHPVAREM